MKIHKATFEQHSQYDGLYPLYATAEINAVTVHIEKLDEAQGPKYEIVLPDGYIDGLQQQHFLLCFDREDLEDRLKTLDPVPCTCCGGKSHAG